jgi:hypothetical protein
MDDTPVSLVVLNTELPRDKAANEVAAQFASFTEGVTTIVDRMSGFYIVVFDDEGNPYSTMHFGEMFPMPMPMVPDVVRECCVQDVYRKE